MNLPYNARRKHMLDYYTKTWKKDKKCCVPCQLDRQKIKKFTNKKIWIPPLLHSRGGIFHAVKAAWHSIGIMQPSLIDCKELSPYGCLCGYFNYKTFFALFQYLFYFFILNPWRAKKKSGPSMASLFPITSYPALVSVLTIALSSVTAKALLWYHNIRDLSMYNIQTILFNLSADGTVQLLRRHCSFWAAEVS